VDDATGTTTEVPSTEETTAYLPGASWGQVALIGVIVAALAFAAGWKLQQGSTPGADSVDVGFLRDMIDHHDQAVLMSLLVMRPGVGVDGDTLGYASEIVVEQRFQIGQMTAWLDDWGVGRGEPDRRAMGWMVGEQSTPVPEMLGMQPPSAIDALRAATGSDAARRFLEMMIQHHLGGIHMADDAARHAGEQEVRDLAKLISTTQRGEIADLRHLQEKLGFPVT
jgi:uncharacterized protein (DUF305 family)